MITATLALVLLGASCEHPALASVPSASQEAACALLATPPPAEPLSRATLEDIYRRPGFERARERNTGAFQAFLAQLRAWFERLFGSAGAETYSNYTRVVVLALAVAVALAATLRLLARRKQAAAPPPAPPTARALALDDPLVHQARARALLEAQPREAIREGLLSLLSSLERRRLARPDRVKTNRELAAELPARGAPGELVQAVARLFAWFDRAFYSLDPVPPGEAKRFLADVEALVGAPE